MANRPENTIVGCIQNGFLGRMMHFSSPAIVVWLAIANRADASGCCHPSITTLQGDTGLSRSTIYRAMDQLVERGEITVTPGGGKGNPSNQYQIGGIRNELVQEINQFNRETKVVSERDSNQTQEPNRITRLCQTVSRRHRSLLQGTRKPGRSPKVGGLLRIERLEGRS